MRAYPRNSMDAAARIVALVMLCDGRIAREEADLVESRAIDAALGLVPGQWQTVVQELTEDLLATTDPCWDTTHSIDAPTLATLFDEVGDRALQTRIARLAADVVEADGQLADSEMHVMAAAVAHWRLEHEMLLGADSRVMEG